MQFKIYQFELKHRHLSTKQGFLLEKQNGKWSEVSPLNGRSKETLQAALKQLCAIQQGWRGPLFPSVAFGLYGLTAPVVSSIPCALFLCGTPEEVIKTSLQPHGCTTAKLKVGNWNITQTLETIRELLSRFHLRIDFNLAWKISDISQLCSHLSPEKIEFLEDTGAVIDPFATASDAHSHPQSITVWKPMVLGLPQPKKPVILSSSLESSIGLHNIASLIQSHDIPSHVLGIGTIVNLEDDLVKNRAFIQGGKIHFPSSWKMRFDRLTPC